MFEQLNFFDDFMGFADDFKMDSSKKKETILSSPEDYLKKGDKIFDLAKKSYSKKTISEDWLNKLWEIKYSDDKDQRRRKRVENVLSKIARSVTRPILRNMVTCEDTDESVIRLREMLPKGIKVTFEPTDIPPHYLKNKPKEDEKIIRVFVAEDENRNNLSCIGFLRESHSSKLKAARLCSTKENVTDLGELFASFLILKTVNEHILSLRENGVHDRVYEAIMKHPLDESFFFDVFGEKYRECFELRDADVDLLFQKTWWFLNRPIDLKWKSLMEKRFPQLKTDILQEVSSDKKGFEYVKELYQISETECDCTKRPFLFLPYTKVQERYAYLVLTGVVDGFSHFLCKDVYSVMQLYEYAFPMLGESCLISLFLMIAEEKRAVVNQERFTRELSGDYARSYMTKKNIPKSIVKEMETSGFNEYFGYVEMDESVDITLVEEIYKEFVAVKETYLKGMVSTDNSIRFRRLGNHKASGLYYPSVKCLCVDIGHPSSMIHEYGHLIDYTRGELSLKGSFLPIRERYTILLEQNDRKEELKGKYDMDYYLMPTEIFARCFEMYLAVCKGVDNSLLKTTNFSWVYPNEDELLMKEVETYYDNLLDTINKET